MALRKVHYLLGLICLTSLLYAETSYADGLFRRLMAKGRDENKSIESGPVDGLYAQGAQYQGKKENEKYGGRAFSLYVPAQLPPMGQRKLVVILHGGFGSATQIQSYLGLDPYADQYGFIVAYLNGTQVMRIGSDKLKGWNAGECCGQPQIKNIDDVGYISGTVEYITQKYGVNPAFVYGMGHSNGAMMTYRLMCETDLYSAAIPMSGALELDTSSCPMAQGKGILALHGANDVNVPIKGGHGEGFNTRTNYRSQAYTENIFKNSGAEYELYILKNADHSPKTINAALIRETGMSLPQTIVAFFGLDQTP